ESWCLRVPDVRVSDADAGDSDAGGFAQGADLLLFWSPIERFLVWMVAPWA
ncbi:hypothetical protein Dimus_024212, partial [Dionaea muscipula]